jgi:O-antigen biosynthesis protein
LKFSEIFLAHEGKLSDKWASYLPIYDQITSEIDAKSILEIGVQNGGSLEIWSKIYPKAEVILGLDIEPKCAELAFEAQNIRVMVADASKLETKAEIEKVSANFDLIIDDGSHSSPDIIAALVNYLPLVNPGGIFVVEDLHASYWPTHHGGLLEEVSAQSFIKRIIDVINFEHWNHTIDVRDYLAGYHEISEEFLEALSKVRSVEFTNSVTIFRVAGSDEPVGLGPRVVVGSDATVWGGSLDYKGSDIASIKPKPTELEESILLDPRAFSLVHDKQKAAEVRLTSTLNELDLVMDERRALVSELVRTKAEILRVLAELEKSGSEVAELESQVSRLNKATIELETRMAELESQLNEILQSRTWRWSKPFRSFGVKPRGK